MLSSYVFSTVDTKSINNAYLYSLQICVLADCIGAMLVYSALCYQNNRNSYDTQSSESLPTNFSSKNNMGLSPGNTSTKFQRSFSIDEPPRVRTDSECQKFEFHITDFFCCGSPIGLIMMKKLIDVGHGKCSFLKGLI